MRNEFVLAVEGLVELRPDGTINKELTTGEIDIAAEKIEVLNKSKTTPFEIQDDLDVNEELTATISLSWICVVRVCKKN